MARKALDSMVSKTRGLAILMLKKFWQNNRDWPWFLPFVGEA
jgi:hypothetical protein